MRAFTRSARSSGSLRIAAVLAALVCAGAALAPPAQAAAWRFGTTEYLEKIQDTEIKTRSGESLYLAYKYSHHLFIVPYRMTDDGYVLGVVGSSRRYYTLDAAMIESLQKQKLLPTPLPPYSISLIDYLFGHLLWIVVAGIGVSILFAFRREGREKQAVPFAEAGLAHHQTGNLDAAIAEYDKALARNPKFVDALMLRGDAYKARGDIDRAIADYSKVIYVDGRHAVALAARGTAFEAKGLAARAIDDYTRAIRSSKAPVAYFLRANAYLAGGDAAAAIKDYTSAIEGQPDFAEAYQNRAIAYERAGRADLAQADQHMVATLATASPGVQSV
jgi:tetratricopeptide (TPR) repeat protein